MSYSFISEKKEIAVSVAGAVTKKRGTKAATTEENLDNITAKLSTLGISKANAHKTSQQITLSDGTKIIDGSKTEQIARKCNWCKGTIPGSKWGIPLWIMPDGKSFAVEGAYCSPNCCAAFLNYTSSMKHKDSWGLFHLLASLVGIQVDDIVPAAHWTEQTDFGGGLSQEKYRADFLEGCDVEKVVTWTHRLIVAN